MPTSGLTQSEQFVTAVCERAFLRLWTHPNPVGKKGKELCDCLVSCGNHIIIISVKECDYKDTGDKTGWERWEKAAIDKSVSQIWGAERFLQREANIERSDGRKVDIAPLSDRKIHRITVSLGGRGEVPTKWGDFGNGFVHLFDEVSLEIMFSELDTISDFINFLEECERFVLSDVKPVFNGGGVEDLLALYIQNDGSLEFEDEHGQTPDLMVIENDLWRSYSKSSEYRAYRDSLAVSYIWDRLITMYTNDLLTDGMFDMHSGNVTKNELALVAMALQPRGHRANLAESFQEIMENPELKVAARAALGGNRTAFVFMLASSQDRTARSQELGLRCLVIRGITDQVETVIGIATDRPGTSSIGYSCDIAYIHMPEWSTELSNHVAEIQDELGYFANPNFQKRSPGR